MPKAQSLCAGNLFLPQIEKIKRKGSLKNVRAKPERSLRAVSF
jgi:hypothetical protein